MNMSSQDAERHFSLFFPGTLCEVLGVLVGRCGCVSAFHESHILAGLCLYRLLVAVDT